MMNIAWRKTLRHSWKGSNETWLTEFTADQKYLGYFVLLHTRIKLKVVTLGCMTTYKRWLKCSFGCVLSDWVFPPILWHVSPVFQAPSDKASTFQCELDISNAHAMFQLQFVFEACPQANRTISTENKKAHSPTMWYFVSAQIFMKSKTWFVCKG